MSYNHAGQLTAVFGHGYTPSFSYDNNGRTTQAGDTTATYTADGQVAALTQSPPGNPAGNTTTFTYDRAGRLATAALARNGTTVSTATYGWDADGNRASVAVTGLPTVTTSYNLADQAASDSSSDTYSYDPNGNLTTFTTPGGTTSYGYGPFGDLTSATTPSGSATYTPDALGRLTARTSAGSTQQFSYDGTSTLLAARQSAGNDTNLIRDPTGHLLGEAPVNGDPLLAFPDIHGDVTRLSDMTTYAATWTGVYDPFGADTTTGTAPVSLGFQSMYADPATGQTDMAARWYNPASGTFTSMDTIAGNLASPLTLNRYLYGTGDPVDYYDPAGHCSWYDVICDATQAWDSFTSWASATWNTAATWASQQWNNLTSDITQTYASVTTDLATAYHQASQALQDNLPSIKATAASLIVGGTVFLGCEALTAGTGTVGCATAGGAAGGAVYGALMCPQGAPVLHCAATGALAGAIAGATAGYAAGLGLGAAATGALAGGTGNAASQLLTTGHINPGQVATATLTGTALGYAGSKILSTATGNLLGRLGTSVTNGDTTTTSTDTTPLAQPTDTTTDATLTTSTTPQADLAATTGTASEADPAAALRSAVSERATEVIASQSNKVRGPVLTGALDTQTGGIFFGQNTGVPDPLAPELQANLDNFEGLGTPFKGIPGAHSEINALNQGLFARPGSQLSDFLLYSVRLQRSRALEQILMCPNCAQIVGGAGDLP